MVETERDNTGYTEAETDPAKLQSATEFVRTSNMMTRQVDLGIADRHRDETRTARKATTAKLRNARKDDASRAEERMIQQFNTRRWAVVMQRHLVQQRKLWRDAEVGLVGLFFGCACVFSSPVFLRLSFFLFSLSLLSFSFSFSSLFLFLFLSHPRPRLNGRPRSSSRGRGRTSSASCEPSSAETLQPPTTAQRRRGR